MTTEEKTIQIIGIAFDKDVSGLSITDCMPEKIEGWDSLGFLNLINLFEDEFNISFDLEDIAGMADGGDTMLKVLKKAGGG